MFLVDRSNVAKAQIYGVVTAARLLLGPAKTEFSRACDSIEKHFISTKTSVRHSDFVDDLCIRNGKK